MKKRLMVYGRFNHDQPYDGESTKLINIYNKIKESFPDMDVLPFDISQWKKHPVKTLFSLIKHTRNTSFFVIIPGASHGFNFAVRFFSHLIKHKKVHVFYPVAGGWIYEYLKVHYKYIKKISVFDGLFCETIGFCDKLRSLGLHNIFYSPVFTLRKPVSFIEDKSVVALKNNSSFSFCTFSRVIEEKGISLAIKAVSKINSTKGATSKPVVLDIYGKCSGSFLVELNKMIDASGGSVRYNGLLPDSKVIDVLSSYYGCIFDTYFSGECFPATVLECYSSGLPVIASDWLYNKEFVFPWETGLLCSPKDFSDLASKVIEACTNEDRFLSLRKRCLEESKKYAPDKALSPLIDAIKATLK
jgi:glycosyltransferase involved in cell wall biosynthesis